MKKFTIVENIAKNLNIDYNTAFDLVYFSIAIFDDTL